MNRWSKERDWVERARKYDLSQDRKRRAARAEASAAQTARWTERDEALRERAHSAGQMWMDQAERMAKFPLQEVKQEGDQCMTPDGKLIRAVTIVKPVRWSFLGAGRLAELGIRLSRDAIRNKGLDDKLKHEAEERHIIVPYVDEEEDEK